MEMEGDSLQTMLPEHRSSDIAVAQLLVHMEGTPGLWKTASLRG